MPLRRVMSSLLIAFLRPAIAAASLPPDQPVFVGSAVHFSERSNA